MNHIFPRPIVVPLVISSLLINVYFVFFAMDFTFLYYILWLGGFGIFFVRNRERIARFLRGGGFVRFLLLGYAAVLAEEFIVALVHAATEGFTLEGFALRIFQFWAFNLFAFTGFIAGWYVALTRFRYSATDIFLIAGLWGLFSERTLTYLTTSPIGATLLILPVMSTYNLIIAPAIASLGDKDVKQVSSIKRYALAFVAIFVLSIIPMLILLTLRNHFPGAFPPCEYIPCT